AGVDDRPAAFVLDEVEVDVVEPEGQRQARPQHPPGDLDDTAALGRPGKRKTDVTGRHALSSPRTGRRPMPPPTHMPTPPSLNPPRQALPVGVRAVEAITVSVIFVPFLSPVPVPPASR